MSYILDALKKSEQERRMGEMPEITRFETSNNSPDSKKHYLPIALGVLVFMNVVALFFWAPWEGGTESVAQEAPVKEVQQQPIAEAKPVPVKPIQQIKPVAKPVDTQLSRHDADFKAKAQKVSKADARAVSEKKSYSSEMISKQDSVRQPEVATIPERSKPEPEIIKPSVSKPEPYVEPVKTSYLPQLQELPASLQAKVPDMSFSSHMYSSQPRYRSIIINGRRLKEGQFLNDEIQVREITDKGVILGLDGTVFEVDVLGQWVN